MNFTRLGNIVSVTKGKKPVFSENPSELSIRVLQIDDLRNDNNLKYTDESNGVLAFEEDILLAWDGANAGTIGYGKRGYIGSTIAVLRIKNLKEFSTAFIGKYLQSQFDFFRETCTGATIPHIDRKALDNLKIPVLHINEQIHIAQILTKSETLILKRKESITLLDELLKSFFLEMFGDPLNNKKGWGKDKIGNKCKVTKLAGYEYTKHIKYLDEGEIIAVKGLNVKKGKLKLDNISYINKDISNYLIRSKLFKGDVVMTYIGINIGDVAIIEEDNKYHLAPNVSKITPIQQDEINSYYLLHYLMYNNWLFVRGTTDTAKPSLNMSEIREIQITIPPINLQKHFEIIVKNIDTLKVQFQESLRQMELMFGSLNQIIFKGEFTPNIKFVEVKNIEKDRNKRYNAAGGVTDNQKKLIEIRNRNNDIDERYLSKEGFEPFDPTKAVIVDLSPPLSYTKIFEKINKSIIKELILSKYQNVKFSFGNIVYDLNSEKNRYDYEYHELRKIIIILLNEGFILQEFYSPDSNEIIDLLTSEIETPVVFQKYRMLFKINETN